MFSPPGPCQLVWQDRKFGWLTATPAITTRPCRLVWQDGEFARLVRHKPLRLIHLPVEPAGV